MDSKTQFHGTLVLTDTFIRDPKTKAKYHYPHVFIYSHMGFSYQIHKPSGFVRKATENSLTPVKYGEWYSPLNLIEEIEGALSAT